MNHENSELVHLIPMARQLAVSVIWLRSEAEQGRIPCIKAGRTILFNPRAVQASLVKQANQLQGENSMGDNL